MKITEEEIFLRQPDDWHLHLRDGTIMEKVLPYSASVFGRAIVMPNLDPPITSIQAAIDYKNRILYALPKGNLFLPLMTVYLTEDISPEVLECGFKEGVFFAAKLYPANATTNSSQGVKDINNIDTILETMERIGMPLLIHGEVTDPIVDIFDREEVFIKRYLEPLLERYPDIRVVLEHITTEQAVEFVEKSSAKIAATITPHHLHINRNQMFQGGFRSDFYCLPVAKREKHRLALRKAATSGKECFFLGTDSAPHERKFKENACSCAGIFNAPYALESYAEVFQEEGELEKLEAFSSEFGAKFYGLPLNSREVRMIRRPHIIPKQLEKNQDLINDFLPFHAGETLTWKVG